MGRPPWVASRPELKGLAVAGTTLKVVIEQFDDVDEPDVLERARSNPALSLGLHLSRSENC
jgi:hypothetical protein